MRDKSNKAIPLVTVQQYVEIKDALTYTPFRAYPDGRRVYLYNGEEVPELEFKRRFRLPASLVVNNTTNYDQTKKWLQ